jgi:hypothetical protein
MPKGYNYVEMMPSGVTRMERTTATGCFSSRRQVARLRDTEETDMAENAKPVIATALVEQAVARPNDDTNGRGGTLRLGMTVDRLPPGRRPLFRL